jgi:hypothetical protein
MLTVLHLYFIDLIILSFLQYFLADYGKISFNFLILHYYYNHQNHDKK